MSKSGPSTTQQNTATLPPHITQAQQNLIGTTTNLTNPFLSQVPNYSVMGLTPDQLTAADLTRQTANQLFSTPQIKAYDVFGMGNQWNTGSPVQGGQATATSANAAQLDPNAISQFMNPYIDTALNPVLDRLRQQQQEVQGRIGADAAASHMFGGSREAVSRMLADRNYRDQVGQTTGNMLMQGWNNASGLASGNTDRSQATNLFNANAANDISKTNAGLGQQAALQQQNLAFQGAQNDANRFLQALQQQSGMDTTNLNNKMNIINLLNSMGGQTRAVGQQSLDAPWTALQRLQQATPMAVPQSTTSTSQTEKPVDFLSTLLGIGGLAFGGPAGGAAGSALGGLFR